jgi:hypothetical protein
MRNEEIADHFRPEHGLDRVGHDTRHFRTFGFHFLEQSAIPS